MPNEIQVRYTREKLIDFGFKPIGALIVGDITLILERNQDDLFALEPIDPDIQMQEYRQRTEHLNPKNFATIPNVDPTKITYLQLDSKELIKANWIETTSGADKPELEIPTKDAIFFDEKTIELSEDLIRDLFTPKSLKPQKLASFFTLETCDLEVVGIAIRGNNPKIILLPPAVDASRSSTIAGLNNFLEAVYGRLKEKTTQIQKQVDNAIFEASLPTKGQLVFSAKATKETLANVHRRIYQIQALLIALRSDDKLGTQDPAILIHAPFLKQEVTGVGALFQNRNGVTTVDGSIWNSLVEIPGAGFITTDPKPRQKTVIRQPAATPTTVNNTTARPPASEVSPTITEKQKAVELAKDLESGLTTALVTFKDYAIDTLGTKQIQEFTAKIEPIAKSAERYTATRKRGKAPASPTPSSIKAGSAQINLAGIKDSTVFSFITGDQTITDYKLKIDSGLNSIQNTLLPLMKATNGRQERLLSNVKKSNPLLRIQEVSTKLIPELDKLAASAGKNDLFTAEVSFVILGTQILYTLLARYQELKSKGTEVEIDNWASYCYTVTDRLKTLSVEMISK